MIEPATLAQANVIAVGNGLPRGVTFLEIITNFLEHDARFKTGGFMLLDGG